MRIVLHKEIPDDPLLLQRWNGLVQKMERPEVFYTCQWALAVQAAYGSSLQPLLFLAYDGDDLAGIASLATDAAGQVKFLAATTADYCEFLSDPRRRTEFVDLVFAELRRMNVNDLALANLPADSATLGGLRAAARKHGFYVYARPAYLCGQIDLPRGQARQEMKTALQNKKKLRYHLRALEREGAVTFAHLDSWERIREELPKFADAHVARFKAMHRASSLETPQRRRFVEELARRFSGTDVVTLSLMMVGGRPVAWNYGFKFCGSWFWYQPTFDSRYEENSPGHCLLSKIVIEACGIDEMKVVDLGLGAEGYKERFANGNRQTLYALTTRSWRRHLQGIARHRTVSVIRRAPKIEGFLRLVLGRPSTGDPSRREVKKHLD